jgi:hypothetical protein
MLHFVALVRTDILEERISIIMVKRIRELGTLAVTSNCSTPRRKTNPDDEGDTFLPNVGSYKSHTS